MCSSGCRLQKPPMPTSSCFPGTSHPRTSSPIPLPDKALVYGSLTPHMGSRSIQAQLNRQGIAISRVRVRALMRLMGL
ncbi:MAG: transposase, partial [Verrucomicrobia bacterium]|nr:transposase [Verrucomicrobiota bacterium]